MSNLHLNLTDAFSKRSDTFPIAPSISDSGNQVYLVYEITVDNTHNLAAELFQNVNGKLISSRQFQGDLAFPNIDEGYANSKFTRFSLLDDNGVDTVRIRLLDSNLTVIATNTFTDYAPGNGPCSMAVGGSYSFAGGFFSADDRYIVISYQIRAFPNTPQITVLRVVDAETLQEIASTTLNGGSYGPTFLNFCKHGHLETFITLSVYQGDFTIDLLNNCAQPPSTLYVYSLHNRAQELQLIDTAALPQASPGIPNTLSHENGGLIAVGTDRAVLLGEPVVFVDNSTKHSFLPNDGNEVRIYAFNGNRLCLKFAQNVNNNVVPPTFYPSGKFIVVDQQDDDGLPGFFNLDKLDQTLTPVDKTYVSPPFHSSAFSNNGKWFIVTGSDQFANIFNVNLYRVKKQ
jgi:hypothetical protein